PFFLNPLVYVEGPQQVQQGNPDLKVKEVQIYEFGVEQHAGGATYLASFYFRNAKHDFSQVLSYSASLSPYWNEIEAGPLDVTAGRRTLYSVGGRFNLN